MPDFALEEFRFLGNQISGQKWAVVGASGWIGSNIVHFGREFEIEIDSYGSHARTELIAGREAEVKKYDLATFKSSDYDFIWDCAFQTREKLKNNPDLSDENSKLIEMSKRLLSRNDFGAYVYFSSGAAIAKDGQTEPYALAKSIAEMELSEIGSARESDLRIHRLWNVTGPYCRKLQDFAFTSLIHNAVTLRKVRFSSETYVWRRFADLRQIIGLAVAKKNKHPLDSGGELVEIREIARHLANLLPFDIEISDRRNSDLSDRYYSDSKGYESALIDLGLSPRTLNEQIQLALENYGY